MSGLLGQVEPLSAFLHAWLWVLDAQWTDGQWCGQWVSIQGFGDVNLSRRGISGVGYRV